MTIYIKKGVKMVQTADEVRKISYTPRIGDQKRPTEMRP